MVNLCNQGDLHKTGFSARRLAAKSSHHPYHHFTIALPIGGDRPQLSIFVKQWASRHLAKRWQTETMKFV